MHRPLFVAVAVLAGCGASVHSTTMPGANLTPYRTFSFRQPTDVSEQTPAAQTIRQEIASSLEAKGLRQVSRNPDFVIGERVTLEQKVSYTSSPLDYYGSEINQFTEGTLIVDFIDPRTNAVIWRGTASQVTKHPENPDLGRVASAVNKLMEKYPSQMASAGAPSRM